MCRPLRFRHMLEQDQSHDHGGEYVSRKCSRSADATQMTRWLAIRHAAPRSPTCISTSRIWSRTRTFSDRKQLTTHVPDTGVSAACPVVAGCVAALRTSNKVKPNAVNACGAVQETQGHRTQTGRRRSRLEAGFRLRDHRSGCSGPRAAGHPLGRMSIRSGAKLRCNVQDRLTDLVPRVTQ